MVGVSRGDASIRFGEWLTFGVTPFARVVSRSSDRSMVASGEWRALSTEALPSRLPRIFFFSGLFAFLQSSRLFVLSFSSLRDSHFRCKDVQVRMILFINSHPGQLLVIAQGVKNLIGTPLTKLF